MFDWFLKRMLNAGRVGRQVQLGVRGSHGGYDPNQPRVPAGHPNGGQWTSTGGAPTEATRPPAQARSLDEIIRDAIEDASLREVFASARARRGPIVINGRPIPATPGQLTRLAEAEAEGREAVSRVQEIEPNWRPRPSAYETVEGLIRAHQADARAARERLIELTYYTGPGRFAAEWVPAPAPGRRLSREGQRRLNEIGSLRGCHTCGTFNPGTRRRNYIGDHQEPTALGAPSRIYPQCLHCSNYQGGKVRALLKKRGR